MIINTNYIKRVDKFIIPIIIFLMISSLLMMYSLSSNSVFTKLFITQAGCYFIGFVLWVVLYFLDVDFLKNYYIPIMVIAILFQLLIYTPLGLEINDSRAWLDFKFISIQPSEFNKILFIIAISSFIHLKPKRLDSFIGFVLCSLFALPLIVLIAKDDLGSGIVMIVIFVGLIFVNGISLKLFVRLSIFVAVCIPIIYRFLAPHQKERIEAFLHPDNLNIGANYHIYRSKLTISTGGLFGKGLGKGEMSTLNFLPVKESDFIFSVLVESLGLLFGILIIIAFLFLSYRIFRLAVKTNDKFQSSIVMGIGIMLSFEALENILMTMGMLPVAGIALPFLSAGGSSLLASMIAIGIILNISMRNRGFSVKS